MSLSLLLFEERAPIIVLLSTRSLIAPPRRPLAALRILPDCFCSEFNYAASTKERGGEFRERSIRRAVQFSEREHRVPRGDGTSRTSRAPTFPFPRDIYGVPLETRARNGERNSGTGSAFLRRAWRFESLFVQLEIQSFCTASGAFSRNVFYSSVSKRARDFCLQVRRALSLPLPSLHQIRL